MNITFLSPVKRLLSKPYWWLRSRITGFRILAGDTVKAFVMLVVLRPAADYLPAKAAFALARAFGILYALMPFYGLEHLFKYKRTFHLNNSEALTLAGACLSRHYQDFVAMRRIVKGRENPQKWNVVETNTHLIDELRRSDHSYIVATGHFNRFVHAALCLDRFVPQKYLAVANPPFDKSFHPRILWLKAHYGQMLDVFRLLSPTVHFVNPGQKNLFKEIIKELKAPGNALQIYVDAPWDSRRPGGYSRPFAGRASKSFATGAARLSRLAQCPLILCLPYMDNSGQFVLDWIRIIQPPELQDSDADMINTNILLDDIEREIGKRPDQYVMDVLGERTWNSEKECWED